MYGRSEKRQRRAIANREMHHLSAEADRAYEQGGIGDQESYGQFVADHINDALANMHRPVVRKPPVSTHDL